tara:strand:+ start:4478 stop:5095 length:618 start_codon:yes stop_codon:yes gene_type:complete
MKTIFIIPLLLMSLISPASWGADFEKGVAAYERKDYGTALILLEDFALMNNSQAQYLLGNMYGPRSWSGINENRYGVASDDRKAIMWWRKAAEQGHAEAQFQTGYWLYTGQMGLDANVVEGAAWYRKSADQGNYWAQQELGFAYRQGRGVPKDYVLAYMWLNLSASGNWEYANVAASARDSLGRQMAPKQITEAQRLAREWVAIQ